MIDNLNEAAAKQPSLPDISDGSEVTVPEQTVPGKSFREIQIHRATVRNDKINAFAVDTMQ